MVERLDSDVKCCFIGFGVYITKLIIGRKKIEFVKPLQSLSFTKTDEKNSGILLQIHLYERQKGEACNAIFSEIFSAMKRSLLGKSFLMFFHILSIVVHCKRVNRSFSTLLLQFWNNRKSIFCIRQTRFAKIIYFY